MIIVDVQGWGVVAVGETEPEARLRGTHALTGSRESVPAGAKIAVATVEVLHRYGGMSPRCLLGGRFVPNAGRSTDLVVDYTEEPLMPILGVPSAVGVRGFAVGLPHEFAVAVLDGLHADDALPSGVVHVDQAGVDEVDSSSFVFREAAALLACVLAARSRSLDVEASLRAYLADGYKPVVARNPGGATDHQRAEVSMNAMEAYRARLLQALATVKNQLSRRDHDLVASLIDGNEGPEAMLALAWTIVEGNLGVSADLIAELRTLAGDFIDPTDFPPDLDAHTVQ